MEFKEAILSNVLRALIVVSVLTFLTHPAHAWSVVEHWLDPIGGRTYTAAGTTNEDGYSIFIFRDVDDRVRMLISIPNVSFDRLPKEGRVLALRPGGFKVSDVEAAFIDTGVSEKARSDGRNVRSLLWHGQEASPTRGTLRNMLDSEMLSVRFYTDTGGTIDTSWSMDGAPEAISSAVGIATDALPEEVEWSNRQAELLISSSQRCEVGTKCFEKIVECMKILQSPDDADRFKRCVDAAAP